MTRAREAARLIGNNTFRLDSNNAVGFNSTTPDAMFDINHGLTVAGVSTFTGNVTMSGDLTVQGTTTTLDTIVQEVDLMNIQANSSTPGLGVTQSGSGNVARFYDGTSAVFTIADGGGVTVESGVLTLNNNLDMQDSDVLQLGTGDDLKLYHDGSNSLVENYNGGLFIDQHANDGDINLRTDDGSGGTTYYVVCDGSAGSVILYHYGSTKLETTGAGVTVTGVTTSRGFVLAEDDGIHFRTTAADDLDAILRENSSNTLLINSRNDAILNIDSNNDSTDAHFAIGHGAATGSSTELFRVQENGNVGIGSAIPGYMLDIASTNASMRINSTSTSTLVITSGSGQSARIEFGDLANNDTGYIYYDNSDDSMQFATNGSNERLRITSAGKVGINSEGTTAYLTIRDSEDGGDGNNGSGVLRFSRRNGSATKDAILYAIHDGSDGVRALKLDVGNSERFRVSAAGVNVTGITTASQLFEGTNRVATAGKAVAMALVFG